LFVALLPPPYALDEISAAIAAPRERWARLRWVDPALWHVTLAFLGEVPDHVLPDLDARLSRAAARHAPMTMRFRGAGAFPSSAHPRNFWIGLSVDSAGLTPPPLTRLAASVAAGARRAGAPRPGGGETGRKPFHPHLTLARVRHPDNLGELVDELHSFAGRAWEAKAVHLMRSHLGARVRYESVAAYLLGRRD
jgi:2'-5' RNA ligase